MTIHVPSPPGVSLELDFAGKTLWLRDRHNPEKKTKVTVFVAALSYSELWHAQAQYYKI